MRSNAQAHDVVAFINERHGTKFHITGRFPQGEQGAFALVDPDEACFVLRWRPNAQDLGRICDTQSLVCRLYDAGYPVPRDIAIGRYRSGSYIVQEALPGVPLAAIDASLLPQVLTLNALQEDQAAGADVSWPNRVIDDVLFGGSGYCLLDPMRKFSSTTAHLLATLQDFVAAHANITAVSAWWRVLSGRAGLTTPR